MKIFKRKITNLEFLQKCEYHDVEPFSLNNYSTWAKVVKIYDGDTMTVVFFFADKPYRFRIRLADIDTAEKKSKNPDERKYSQLAIKKCQEYIDQTNGIIYIKCHRFDKYGRILATIQSNPFDKTNLNEILLECNLAYKYDGGTKILFHDWIPKK